MIYAHRNVVIRDATLEDVDALGHNLREADEKEVIAAGNQNGEHALRQSFTRSTRRYSVVIGGTVSAMFGIVPCSLLGDSANVWFLGSPEMSRIKKTFVRLSRPIIDLFLAQYPHLFNYVDGRYESSIKWLKFCGADFTGVQKLNGIDFHSFAFRRA